MDDSASASIHGSLAAEATTPEHISGWREAYRDEMRCQIIHDSIHVRPGWTHEYLLSVGGEPVGYGSVAVAGPWRDQPALYEIYVEPRHRPHLLDLAKALLRVSGAAAIEVQSNDRLAQMVLHHFAGHIHAESLLFEDAETVDRPVGDGVWRHPTAEEAPELSDADRRWRGVIEVGGQVVASGGVLFHYNPPYGDIYMEVLETHRRLGLGTRMVQELKRRCREEGFIPAARCNPANEASRRTLQKAGFRPCGHLVRGTTNGNR